MEIWEVVKELVPVILTALSTIVVLKNKWISSLFTRSKEAAQTTALDLENITTAVHTFKTMLDNNDAYYQKRIADMEKNFAESLDRLGAKIDELDVIINDQRLFIQKQSKSLDYYQKKYGDRNDNIK